MSNEHTPGPWTVNGLHTPHRLIHDSEGRHIASVETSLAERDDEDEANARRIVACVNACDGFDTDYLESVTREGESLLRRRIDADKVLDNSQCQVGELMRQRNDLLAALQKFMGQQYIREATQSTDIGVANAADYARAVIAKVTGAA